MDCSICCKIEISKKIWKKIIYIFVNILFVAANECHLFSVFQVFLKIGSDLLFEIMRIAFFCSLGLYIRSESYPQASIQ